MKIEGQSNTAAGRGDIIWTVVPTCSLSESRSLAEPKSGIVGRDLILHAVTTYSRHLLKRMADLSSKPLWDFPPSESSASRSHALRGGSRPSVTGNTPLPRGTVGARANKASSEPCVSLPQASSHTLPPIFRTPPPGCRSPRMCFHLT